MDDEESNIKKARPKQGLETGSLISGKERVAQAYAKSLSGAEGPVAQFDAVDEIARLQVQQAFDRMTFSSPAGSPAIFGRNGHYAIQAPRARDGRRDDPVVSQFLQPWDLTLVNDSGGVKINCGTIIKDASDLTGQITISSADSTFTPSAGHTIRLKIAGTFDTPTVTLESGGSWTDHPAAYETTGSTTTAEFAAYYYPLWEFVGTAAADTVRVTDSVNARRLVGFHHFLRNVAAYHKPTDRPFAVPFLLPYHRALTA